MGGSMVQQGYEEVNCFLCGSTEKKELFTGYSREKEPFIVNRCSRCSLEYVSPRPDVDAIGAYYTSDYFTRRDDRGYNDYFSPETAAQIEHVLHLNLKDLGFFHFEEERDKGLVLDIGCAAGYSVQFFAKRGWKSRGIDIATDALRAGVAKGLDLIDGSYLTEEFSEPFKVVTMWATIEHLHHPEAFIEKIARDLEPGGMVYLSTCRTGGLNFKHFFGKNWRFYNPPEHLYYFTRQNLETLLERKGFRVTGVTMYGSGFGKPGSVVRKAADWMAKNLNMGDMIILAAEKK
jgi:2-polyprenyl-3-methyl-5-hydroxy-6-metoxy-1,4-benzoquinol methylase